MADHLDPQRPFRSVAGGVEHGAHGGDGDKDENQRRRERPSDLENRMPVDRFWLGRAGTGAKPRDRDQEQRFDDEEHHHRPPEDVLEQPVQLGAEIGARSEDRLWVMDAGAAGENEEKGDEY